MENDKYFEEIKKNLLELKERDEESFKDLSKMIDDVIFSNIKDEKIISIIYDALLDLVINIDSNLLRETFYRLSYYCRSFNKSLANDYDKFLEKELNEPSIDDIYFDHIIEQTISYYSDLGYSNDWIKSKFNDLIEDKKDYLCN